VRVRCGRWPAGEVFLSHRHWGGEEIPVLSGIFCGTRNRDLGKNRAFAVNDKTVFHSTDGLGLVS